ncbi:hypothetical protein [Legionella drozanskii]|uniref:hypothetical protein n=1 Tax=Legionella drozanskii TaxID=96228 RepID=UPI00104130D3|nr:hypothetical protein [Legionella drozanskii]
MGENEKKVLVFAAGNNDLKKVQYFFDIKSAESLPDSNNIFQALENACFHGAIEVTQYLCQIEEPKLEQSKHDLFLKLIEYDWLSKRQRFDLLKAFIEGDHPPTQEVLTSAIRYMENIESLGLRAAKGRFFSQSPSETIPSPSVPSVENKCLPELLPEQKQALETMNTVLDDRFPCNLDKNKALLINAIYDFVREYPVEQTWQDLYQFEKAALNHLLLNEVTGKTKDHLLKLAHEHFHHQDAFLRGFADFLQIFSLTFPFVMLARSCMGKTLLFSQAKTNRETELENILFELDLTSPT